MTCMTCTFMVFGAWVQVIFSIKANEAEQGTAQDLHLSYARKSSTLTCTPCTHMPDFFFLREKPAFSSAA